MTRLLTLVLALVYGGVAVFIGTAHDHDHHGGDCAACVWQLSAATDTPVPSMTVVVHFREVPIAPPVTVSAPVAFVPASASRAPPATPA